MNAAHATLVNLLGHTATDYLDAQFGADADLTQIAARITRVVSVFAIPELLRTLATNPVMVHAVEDELRIQRAMGTRTMILVTLRTIATELDAQLAASVEAHRS